MTALSLEWGFHEATVRRTLKTHMPNVEPRIARFIGKTLHEIWPDRYDKDNIRILPYGRKYRASHATSHCKKINC